MKPPIWEAPLREPDRDILSEERVRPRRWWWPGSWLTGRTGMTLLAVFVVGGLGWTMVSRIGVGPSGAPGAGEAPRVNHPESGRRLAPAEYGLASEYGSPLFLGKGGLPVVRMETTGRVRELTPVEAEFESSLPYVSAGYGEVVWTPGPRGWGLWWKDDVEERLLSARLGFPRDSWRDRQQAELSHAAARVTEGLRVVELMDLELWRPGIGPALEALMAQLRFRYPVVEYGNWGVVPARWQCDRALESDLNQGVTPGCPGSEYVVLLEDAWVRLGAVVVLLEGIGRLGAEMDVMSAADLYQSGLVRQQVYALADLLEGVRKLELGLERLWVGSRAVDLPVSVRLFSEG